MPQIFLPARAWIKLTGPPLETMMRRTINGVTYDTEVSKLIASSGSDVDSRVRWSLYRSTGRRWFEVAEDRNGIEILTLKTSQDAMHWLKANSPHLVERYFSALGNERPHAFIIHGLDHNTRDTVVNFLMQFGFHTTILDQSINSTEAIIEKFERESTDVDCAIAIMTPDDPGIDKRRARQNVVFEFGFFIGKIGRKRVIALVKSDLELFSDISGILYIKIDDYGGWKNLLDKELIEIKRSIGLPNH